MPDKLGPAREKGQDPFIESQRQIELSDSFVASSSAVNQMP
jgi:hypothetical protein